MSKDFSIVIQGPLHEKSLGNIDNYRKFGKVIISCWDTCDLSLVPHDVELVISNEDDYHLDTPRNNCNLHRQCVTTYNGLTAVETDFAIKVRSDEYYTDLSFILDSLSNNPSKIIIGNSIFGRNEWDFSDHIYAARTHILMQTMLTMLSYCEYKEVNFNLPRENCNETILLYSMLRALGKEGSTYKAALLDNFILAPSHFLGDFFAISNVCKVQFTPANVEDGYLTIHSFNHLK